MVINKKSLVSFLKLVSVKGELENKEALLNIGEKSIKVITISEGKHFGLIGSLDGKFEDIGKIGVDDISSLSNFLSKFKDEELTIEKVENKLEITSKKDKLKILFTLKSPEYIVNVIEEDKLQGVIKKSKGNEFVLKQNILKQIVDYYNSIKSKDLILEFKNGELLLLLKDEKENELISGFEIKEKLDNFSVKVSKQFLEILSTINNDVLLSIKDNCPIYFKYEKDCKLEYILTLLRR